MYTEICFLSINVKYTHWSARVCSLNSIVMPMTEESVKYAFE